MGYTIYAGSDQEPYMMEEFAKIVEEAHDYGIPAILWTYPRGPKITNELDNDILAYSARVALELGADMLKIKYNNNPEGFKWVVKCAGRTKVMIAGGDKVEEHEFLRKTDEILKCGVTGMAVGRNVWQHKHPLAISKALRKMVHDNYSIDDGLRTYEEELHKK